MFEMVAPIHIESNVHRNKGHIFHLLNSMNSMLLCNQGLIKTSLYFTAAKCFESGSLGEGKVNG